MLSVFSYTCIIYYFVGQCIIQIKSSETLFIILWLLGYIYFYPKCHVERWGLNIVNSNVAFKCKFMTNVLYVIEMGFAVHPNRTILISCKKSNKNLNNKYPFFVFILKIYNNYDMIMPIFSPIIISDSLWRHTLFPCPLPWNQTLIIVWNTSFFLVFRYPGTMHY